MIYCSPRVNMNDFVLTLKDSWLRLPFNQSEVWLNFNDKLVYLGINIQ